MISQTIIYVTYHITTSARDKQQGHTKKLCYTLSDGISLDCKMEKIPRHYLFLVEKAPYLVETSNKKYYVSMSIFVIF